MAITVSGTLELVSRNEDGLVYNQEAFAHILTRNELDSKPVALLSVAGPMRQGKSFLLSVIVCYLEWLEMEEEERPAEWLTPTTALTQFHWRCGSRPDTTGITIYSRPFLIKQADGEELVVLLVDTQGSFDSSSTLNENAKIFGLSTLMSSLQIFNLMRNIREDDLQNLSLFTEIARMDQDDHNSHLQALNFLIRDWPSGDDEHPCGFDGGNDFLKEKLKVSDDQPSEVNRVRLDLTSSFSSLSCFLLPYPGRNIDNRNKEHIFGEADEEFKRNLQIFVESTIDSLKPKSFGGRVVLCAEFPLICENFSKILTNDGTSMARNAFEATSQIQYELAINKAMYFFEREMKEVTSEYVRGSTGINEEFRSRCSTAKSHAWRIFHGEKKIFVEEILRSSIDKLTLRLQDEYNKAVEEVRRTQEEEKNKKDNFRKGAAIGALGVTVVAGAVVVAIAAPESAAITASTVARAGLGVMTERLVSTLLR